MAKPRETLLMMECQGDTMMGVAHLPQQASDIGVIVVVGGPQYRVGSHRQFLLLARDLAEQGIPVLRFDYRGMGDSGGDARDFEDISQDIQVAVDAMSAQVPETTRWVLWGLCDAATASAFYTRQDPRIVGLVLLNPWVRTEEGASEAYLKHYYLQRVLSPAFWKKLASGGFQWRESWQSFKQKFDTVYRGKAQPQTSDHSTQHSARGPLPERLLGALQAFRGRVLLILSGNDLTAKEFEQAVAHSVDWQRLMTSDNIEQVAVEGADHTFSRRVWRDEVARTTLDWLRKV